MSQVINVEPNSSQNITLFDTHDIRINRKDNNDVELVIYPCAIGKLSIRYANPLYQYTIYFDNGYEEIDLWYCEDFDNINIDDPQHPKYGNEKDGYREIVEVKDAKGRNISLEKFSQDVSDLAIYNED